MDWSKLNMDEIFYYCKSSDCDFDCCPFDLQMENLVLMFHYYGIEQFTLEDIQELYKKLQVPKPKSTGIIKPTPNRIREVVLRMKNIEVVGEDVFKIIPADTGLHLPFDTSLYSCYIEKGYQRNHICPPPAHSASVVSRESLT